MPFRSPRQHFQDIFGSIEWIEQFVGECNFDADQQDEKTKSAVERQLQRLTGAAYRLGVQAEVLCPGPDWAGIAVAVISCGMPTTESMTVPFGKSFRLIRRN